MNPLGDATRVVHLLKNDRRDYLVGLFLLLIVVLLWTFSSFVTQDVFQGGYEKPFLVTWLKMSAFTFYLIPIGLKRLSGVHGWFPHERRSGYERLAVAPPPRNHTISDGGELIRNGGLPPLTTKETMQLAIICCLIFFAAMWANIASLDYTSVASAIILSSMSGFFTLGFGRIFKVESLSVTKAIAVVTSFSGVFLVSLSDSTQTAPSEGVSTTLDATSKVRRTIYDGEYSNPLLGDILALSAAMLLASYIVLLKVKIQQESRINMQLFFGFVGLFNILFLWPIGLILHFTGIEPFELPSDGKTIAGLLVNMFVTVSSDFLCIVAMLKTTPLVVTVGLSLTIPVAVIGDLLLGRLVKIMSLLGALLVLGSFFIIGLEDSKDGEALAGEAAAEEDQARI